MICIHPKETCAQGAERAYEARMKRLYGNSSGKQDDEETKKLIENAPPNIISRKVIFWFYFKNKGTDYIERLDGNSTVLKNYLLIVNDVSIDRYDEFDRRKLVKAAKEEIVNGIAEINYSTEYTCPIMLNSMDEYNFQKHFLRFHTRSNMAQMGAFPDFNFIGLNLAGTTDVLYLDIPEDEAEAVVKRMRGKDFSRNMTVVYSFKVDPKLYSWKGGKPHLTATVSKAAYYYREYRNGNTYFGEKIGETKFGTQPWVHPELN